MEILEIENLRSNIMTDYDVIVVGAGNAAFCSAFAASIDQGARTLVLERASDCLLYTSDAADE